MNPVTQVTNAVRGRQTINPKTVLGFYATVLGLVVAATVSAVGILAANNLETYLIPWLLIFCGAVMVALLVGVFAISLIDPSKLMLTQVTGTEYAHIQQTLTTLGDSSRGDRVELIQVSEATFGTPDETAAIAAVSAGEPASEDEVVVVEDSDGSPISEQRALGESEK